MFVLVIAITGLGPWLRPSRRSIHRRQLQAPSVKSWLCASSIVVALFVAEHLLKEASA